MVLLALSGVAAADTVPPGPVLSKYEVPNKVSLSRDCGFSQALPSGKSLWLFCDTEVWSHTSTGWKQTKLIWGNTAAEGSYTVGEVPTGLTEVPSPPKTLTSEGSNPPPQRFQPNPTDLYIPGSNPPKACPTPLAWPNGVEVVPGHPSLLLITYLEVCNAAKAKTIEGVELVEYNSTTNKVVGGPWEPYKPLSTGAALPDPEQLGSPIFSGSYLYFFKSSCQTAYGVCGSGNVYLARVGASAAMWQSASNYTFWDPTTMTWTSSEASAGSVIPDGGTGAIASTVASFPGQGLVLIESTDIAGGYKVWESASFSPTGPWTAGPSGSVANCGNGSHTVGFFCRSMVGHPELSTSSDLVMSYFSPDTTAYPPAGHELMVAIPW